MKKFLPRTIHNPQAISTERSRSGFTLIELLVVVAIISILAVLAFAIFTGTQKSARDGARRTEVGSISKALEVNRTTSYVPLAPTQFSGNTIPALDASGVPYCINSNTTSTAIADLTGTEAGWVSTPTPGCPTAPAGWVLVSATALPVTGTTTWKVCAKLESTATAFCRPNAQ